MSRRPAKRRVATMRARERRALRAELARRTARAAPARWNADPTDVQRSVVRLVLALVEFLRQLLERQAVRRMEADTLTSEEVEAIGMALMRLEKTVRELARRFDIPPEEINVDLGPLGRLL